MRLQDKVAVVTGAGSGIGRAVALRFSEEGACVCVADIDVRGGEETVSLIEAAGGRAIFHKADTSREPEVKEMADEAARQFGGLDILVNNAAAFVFGTVEQVTEADWDRVLSVNVKGYAFCAKHVIPHLRERGGGAIVNIGSISGLVAQPAYVPYSTSKGAVIQLTRSIAYDFAGENIRVNCVCPGAIDTPAVAQAAELLGMTRQQLLDEIIPLHPMKRIGQPREAANAVLFLASDEASFITGSFLVVDGGYIVQ